MQRWIFGPRDLIPVQWLNGSSTDDLFVFNPAIINYAEDLLMVYRVDFGRHKASFRRAACAICRLDTDGHVIAGSVVALSDTIVDGGDNHYDPRFLIFRDRLFVHYNNNWDSKPNQIYLVELDPDTLHAQSAARPLLLDGPRQEIEKNWMLFDHDGELYAIYQIDPHIVLHLELGDHGPIFCRPVYSSQWDPSSYVKRYGTPRGGTPPVRAGEKYISIFHSRRQSQPLNSTTVLSVSHSLNRVRLWVLLKQWIRRKLYPFQYFGGVYSFAATPPFMPAFIQSNPLLRPEFEDRRRRPTANHLWPRAVVFPGGLVRLDDGRWLVSYGVHDERCVLRILSQNELWSGDG